MIPTIQYVPGRALRFTRRIQYKALASELKIEVELIYRITAGRHLGTFELLAALQAYIGKHGINYPSLEESNDIEETFGLDYVLDEVNIDPDMIASTVEKAAVKYLLFSYLTNGNIACTWVELLNTSKRITLPVFIGRRPGKDGQYTTYKGFYYEYMTTLFLLGHIAETPFARTLVLVPVGGKVRQDWHGVIAGSSQVEPLFVSPCYLKKLQQDAKRHAFEHVLGERTSDEVTINFDGILDNLRCRRNIAISVSRSSG